MMGKIIIFYKKNKCYLAALLMIAIMFFINSQFPAEIITSADCSGDKCGSGIHQPESDGAFSDQEQSDNHENFSELKEENIILGQTFVPEKNYIAGVSLDMDIIRQSNNGGKKYKIELREVNISGEVLEIKNKILSSLDFEIKDLDKFRLGDGKFYFPLQAATEKGKNYFIGINNESVETNRFNYLRLKGTSNDKSYKKGSVAMKKSGKSIKMKGDLYFIVYSLEK